MEQLQNKLDTPYAQEEEEGEGEEMSMLMQTIDAYSRVYWLYSYAPKHPEGIGVY